MIQRTDSRISRSWCLYDWANSAFATTVMAAMFPPFFRQLAIQAGFPGHQATAMWAYLTAGVLLVLAVLAPVLGAIADLRGSRKRYLAYSAGLGVLFTTCFATLGDGSWAMAAILFAGAHIGFSASIIFYEALLPSLASGPEMDKLSARAYGWGYAGGGLLLVLNLLWVKSPQWFGFPDTLFAVKASFVSAALWWGFFAVPLLKWVPEPPPGQAGGEGRSTLGEGFSRVFRTFREVRKYRQVLLFLMAYWIYNDGIGTIIKMATAFGSEIGIGLTDMLGALLLTQLVGVPCTLACGRLAGRVGPRPVILGALAVYLVISLAAFFLQSAWHFYLLAGLVGTAQGGAQALSRSLFASMVPQGRSAEFFGFYATSGKLAGVAGPLIFGLVSQISGTSRLGIVSLVVFFLVGGWLLTRVDVAAGIAAAQPQNAGLAGDPGRIDP